MKRLLAVLAILVVLVAVAVMVLKTRHAPPPKPPGDSAAARPQRSGEAAVPLAVAPTIALRLNGRSPGPEAFVLAQGEPVIAEVQLRHPDRHAKESILLEPPSGSWAGRVKILVTAVDGKDVGWPFVVTGKPSAGGLSLQPAAVTMLVLRMDEGARAAAVPGSYRMSARLDLGDGRGFHGTVDSERANVNVLAAPAAPVGAALGRRQLLRVRDALLRDDVAAAETAAAQMQRAEPRRPEGFIGMALVHEARGERSQAMLSVEIAISQAMGGEEEPVAQEGRITEPQQPPGQKQPPKAAPVEYYEMLRRIDNMPPGPSGAAR
jgi:hypothetical protein